MKAGSRFNRRSTSQRKRNGVTRAASAAMFEPLETRTLYAVYTVSSVADSGAGSLRNAITLSNNTPTVHDTIRFNIGPGNGETHIIHPLTKLPNISGEVTIDATTQGGWYEKYRPVIVISGDQCSTPQANGLNVTTGNTRIYGLAINNFAGGAGLRIAGSGNEVRRCHFGTTAAGNDARPNKWGVQLVGASFNLIGGEYPAQRNLISGNTLDGIEITGNCLNNTIDQNYIGTKINGQERLSNGGSGVKVGTGVFQTLIRGNTISGNKLNGIHLNGADHSTVKNNKIGLFPSGGGGLGNSGNGILVDNGGHHNALGILGPYWEGNKIAYNGQDGIAVASGTVNTIRANDIRKNGQLGIDLGNDGETANDVGDGDTGANGLMNHPFVLDAYWTGTQTNIHASFDAAPNTTYTWEFFHNSGPNWLRGAEGGKWIGAMPMTTDASGHYDGWISTAADVPNSFMSATLTDPAGNTSELSPTTYVRNQKAGLPTMSIADATVTEGNYGNKVILLTVTLSAPLASGLSYEWNSTNGTAKQGQDYVNRGYGYFAPGQTTDTFPMKIVGNLIHEETEIFHVTISPVLPKLVKVTKHTANVVIFDNDAAPGVLAIAKADKGEKFSLIQTLLP